MCGEEQGPWDKTTFLLRLIVVWNSAQELAKELQKFSRVDATKAASSAYSSSQINSRLTFDLARKRERSNNFPEVWQCNITSDGFEKAHMSSAVKKIAKRVGARTHPCLTRRLIGKRRDLEPLTWTVACMSSWSFSMLLSNVSGQPKRLMIANKADLLTRSKALVKSMNATYRGRCCSIHFSCCLNVNTASMVERDARKAHWVSGRTLSAMTCNLGGSTRDKTFPATLSSEIPW